MEIIYSDNDIIVCIKPPRVLSTDEPGGLPELLRAELGDMNADVRTVHRLDRVVGGVMVLARNAAAASELSRQVREDEFKKEYLAVVHGVTEPSGTMRDLLYRDKARRMTFVTDTPAKGVQEAILDYETLHQYDGMSMVRVVLHTGRTHQIRCQFASRGFPLVGERKYCEPQDECEIALWSHIIGFKHPESGEHMIFSHEPPEQWPWNEKWE
ncbi:MAG: RluA family pseudouridine synthase [Clostridia bacterium]|nr:RluA family pseudouridine synthase [Clostridia bacterium]